MSAPFEGLLVVDLSRVLAGPFGAMTLGDLGARVIKIESLAGDDTRRYGPPFAEGESAYYLSVNRNKESVALDFDTPEGADILRTLIDRADIVIENFRPGSLDRRGFGYAACAARNPRLIYASISGYGREGPERSRPGYDLVAQGEGGVMSLTGEPDGPPLKAGVSQADLVTGVWLVGGIATALYTREKTGRGQHLDLALLDGQISLLAFQAQGYFLTGAVPGRAGNNHPMLHPYACWETADGWINVAVGTEGQWRSFCAAIDRAELADDPRFKTNADRVGHRTALDDILVPLFRTHSRDAWLSLLAAADVPAGSVRNVAEALAAPQTAVREMIVTVDHPTIGPLRQAGLPLKFSETPGAPRSAPPRLGEQTDAVLKEFSGCGAERIAELRERGVIGG